MTIKTSAVIEDAVRRIPIADLMSSGPLFEWTIPTSCDAPRARHEGIEFEPDNYQVALVSFRDAQDQAGGTPRPASMMDRLFLLPLTWKQFVTHVRGTIGNSDPLDENQIVRFGRISIDLLSMEVRRSDRPVTLTAMEFRVLRYFVSNPKRVISRDQLLNEVWGYNKYPCTRTVDNHVLKLRQKLESEPADPVHFQTVHGIGYKFIP